MAKNILSKCNDDFEQSVNEYFANPGKFAASAPSSTGATGG